AENRRNLENKRRAILLRKSLLRREQDKYYNLWLRQVVAKRAMMKKKELAKQKARQIEARVAKRKELVYAKKTAQYEKVAVSKPLAEVPLTKLLKKESTILDDIQKQVLGSEISRQGLNREHKKSHNTWLRQVAAKKATIRKREQEEMKKKEAEIRSKTRQDNIKRKILEVKQAALEKQRLKIKEHHDSKFAYRKRRLNELKKKRTAKKREIQRNVFNVFKKKQKKKRIEDIKTKEDIKDYIKV
ncbi:MAG: hypothetical protein GOV02_01105, partial [Candidatus Aenigmarchaeota archaeon]|nr:hypothetical protein [Candidatus Aenigmarchaeota archaeon]